jgi:hypothetical protein
VTTAGRSALAETETRMLGMLERRLGEMREDELDSLIIAFDVLAAHFGTFEHDGHRTEAESA